ncbi:hypothetical protein ACFL9T_10610 [Thermodesulfobacteriota bacterium]
MSDKKEMKVFEQNTENIIINTLTGLAEGLTGIATSSKNELILSVSHSFQKMRGGQFLSAFLKEWNRYRKKGKVKEDYQFTEQHKVCLQELLEFLDKDSPDEVRFDLLKQIFLVAASEEASGRDSFLPQQFMKIARSLSGGEVILLTTIWQFAKEHNGEYDQHYGAARWVKEVTEASGMRYKALVEIHEQGLVDKRLLTPRQLVDKSGVIVKPYYRLTDLGYEICCFIEKYEG